ncbi:hypothetical protein ACGFIF_13575 [Kribbella sp. NPDC049174]|uniref:hypothetical protein n=1 Tax=Kribbella sp. NPDC049174 TaxID=3364112 RepID=UPI00371F16A1
MTPAERISLWLAEMRASGRAAVLARLTIAVAGGVALLVSALQPWDQLDLIPLIAIPMLVATVVLPDSLAGLIFIVVVALGWFSRAPGEVSWSLVLTGIALLVVHLATAFTAQLPSYALVHRQALRRWLVPGAIALLIGPVVAIAAALIQGADVAGSLLVTVAALVLATATIWFAAGQKVGRD